MTDLRKHARKVIAIEAESVAALADQLDENFDRAVEAILKCVGRVIVAGMGKSGLIGNKIVATFNSTGISSFFLHPVEAMHGDLGLMRADDVLMLISKSGRAGEMEMLFAAARRLGLPIIVLCGTPDSELAERSDIVLNCHVAREACPNNLVPTSSSTVTLVMGDALAMALLEARNFSTEDFVALHPGGSIGHRLMRRVSELHHVGESIPLVEKDTPMKDMILEMTQKRLGCVFMKDADDKPIGMFTDGDLRRIADSQKDFFQLKATEVMVSNPKSISEDAVLDAALALMEKHAITQLATVDGDGKLTGIIHLHDILRSKLV